MFIIYTNRQLSCQRILILETSKATISTRHFLSFCIPHKISARLFKLWMLFWIHDRGRLTTKQNWTLTTTEQRYKNQFHTSCGFYSNIFSICKTLVNTMYNILIFINCPLKKTTYYQFRQSYLNKTPSFITSFSWKGMESFFLHRHAFFKIFQLIVS